jgi:hypothetical protein
MDQERNLGVTEARFALTLLTCLLVAIGYVALLRIGGTKDPAAESGSEDVSPPITSMPEPPHTEEPQPRVLPLEKPDSPHASLTDRNAAPTPSANPERR